MADGPFGLGKPVFVDDDVRPSDELIADALGSAWPAWARLERSFADDVGLALEWAFYRDGGWLRKALRGTKNMAWLCVWEGRATVTFYFAARHRDDLVALDVPEGLRSQAATAAMSGAMLPLRIEVRTEEDADAAVAVMRYKVGPR